MEKRSNIRWGYLAGIISGITYGMNPLFGVPVINKGLDVNSLLFYRYGVATLLMLAYMLVSDWAFMKALRKMEFRILALTGKPASWASS